MSDKWYDKQIKQTEQLLSTNLSAGLSNEEVRKRRAMQGENNIYSHVKQPLGNYLAHILTDYTSIIMLATLLIAAVFNETSHLVIMIVIIALYYAMVIVSYVRSENLLDSIAAQALPSAKVLRNGKLCIVRQKELVPGDVLFISTGDIVPCDARLVETDSLEILETSLTGVPNAVRKNALFIDYHDIAVSEQKNMIFATSIVTKGTGKAICCETGEDTLVRVLNKNQTVQSDEQADIFESVNAFCKKWTVFMTIGVFVLTLASIFVKQASGNGLFGTFMLGISAAVASMSEFYTAFAYISLACGIYAAVDRKGDINRGALIKSPYVLEKVKDITCIVVPKDAAFCVKNKELSGVYVNDDVFTPGEHGYNRNAPRVLRYALLSTGLYGSEHLLNKNQNKDNIFTGEEEIIISASEQAGVYNIELEKSYPLIEHVSKGVDSKYDTSIVTYNGRYVIALRGEYRKILPLCTSYTENNHVLEMTPDKLTEFTVEAEKLTRESCRVIAIASKDTIYNNFRRMDACQSELTLEGMIVVKESILPDAAKNISRCKAAGIKTIMLCDDESENNFALAQSLGIASKRSEMVSAHEFSHEKESLIRAGAASYTVYSGLTITQKRSLVKYLQDCGEKVGFLCSELDEIILLRDADVGYTHRVTISDRAGSVELLGESGINARTSGQTRGSGCEALKFVSDVIISDPESDGTGGYNAMVSSILCSHAIYYNMHRMIRYMLTSQVAKLLVVLFSVFSGTQLCSPSQILFCGLIIDFLALIVIAFEKPGYHMLSEHVDIEKLRQPLRQNLFSILVGVLWAGLTILTVLLMSSYGVVSQTAASGCFFLMFIISQLFVVGEFKHEKGIFGGTVKMNGAHVLFILLIAVFVLCLFRFPAFGALFSVGNISYAAIPGIFLVPVLIFASCEIFRELDAKRVRRESEEEKNL